ncbi:hypothetical protein [Cellulomonas massiliensis]|uniref:hypothetical protein n=1 Tax=Cellulomonas massiliensis TaxID=1465811 RepID=UPI0011CC4743|nr:hypothetical protein [Cellulomonas massiliensis]
MIALSVVMAVCAVLLVVQGGGMFQLGWPGYPGTDDGLIGAAVQTAGLALFGSAFAAFAFGAWGLTDKPVPAGCVGVGLAVMGVGGFVILAIRRACQRRQREGRRPAAVPAALLFVEAATFVGGTGSIVSGIAMLS